MSHIANVLQKPSNQNDVEKNHKPFMTVTSYVAMVTFYNFSIKHEFESSIQTLRRHMKDINLCVKFTILERCLHINDHPRSTVFHTPLASTK